MKFVMSYSCGKDSTLALHKMIESGHTLVGLLVMVKKDEDRSYFHGADPNMLKQYERRIPHAGRGRPHIQSASEVPSWRHPPLW